MVDIGGIFGKGSVAEQMFVYGILQNVIGALISPAIQELTNIANEEAQFTPLSVSQAVDMVVRKLIDQGAGEGIAHTSGLSSADFGKLLKSGERSVDIGTAVTAYQRQLIGAGSSGANDETLIGALVDAGIRPEWHGVIKSLAVNWPSPANVMNALLEGQIDRASAHEWYVKGGGNPDWFDTDFNANGEAPTPVQALEMLNRGIIPEGGTGPGVVSYDQAFLEGPWRNKWLPAFRALGVYLPPPRTVTTLVREGAYTPAQALAVYQKTGLSASDAAAYLKSATKPATTTTKDLTYANIIALYRAKLLTAVEATGMLTKLGYDAAEAKHLLALADFNAAAASVHSAQGRIHTLYVNRKITAANAHQALTAIGVAPADVSDLLLLWDIEQGVNVKQLSEAQITGAFHYGVITQGEATAELEAIGYTPWDAWVLLSVREHGALPNMPAKGAAKIGVLP